MKRRVFLLIVTAGVLSLLIGIVMPIMIISYRKRLKQAEDDLARAEIQLENAQLRVTTPNIKGAFPNARRQPGVQADPDVAIPELRYRQSVAIAQDLLARDPFRAWLILDDESLCPPKMHDFAWRWAAQQLPQYDKVLYDQNCHAAALSDDGRTLVVQTGEKEPKIVVVNLDPHEGPPLTLPGASHIFALTHNGSHLAVFGSSKITLHSLAGSGRPPIELDEAGPEIGFSADDSMIVSASSGKAGSVIRWQIDSGKEINRFAVQGDWIKLTADRSALVALTFARDEPGRVTRYNLATGMIEKTVPIALESEKHGKTPYALSNDGTRLATVRTLDGKDRLEMWDLQKGQMSWAVELPPEGLMTTVLCLAFSPDGGSLASVGSNAEVRLWDAATGACHKWFPLGQGGGGPEFLLWQQDGKALIVDTSFGPTRWLPGVAADKVVWTTPEASGGIQSLSPNGHFLASTNLDGAVTLRDVDARRVIATLDATASAVRRLQFSSDGSELAVIREDNTIALVDSKTGKNHANFQPRGKEISDVAFSSDGKKVLTLDNGGRVRDWDCATGMSLKLDQTFAQAALSRNGRFVAYLKNGGHSVVVSDIGKESEVARFEDNHAFASVGFFGDPERIIAVDAYGCFSIWNPETQTRIVDAREQEVPPEARLHAVVWSWTASGDGKTVATLTDYGGLRVYNAETGKVGYTQESLAATHQGRIGVDIWGRAGRHPDTPTGNRLERFTLSRDGRLLVIVGLEVPEKRPYCQVLDGLTGDEVFPVPLPAGPLQDLFFSADGSTLAAVRPKGPITIWKIQKTNHENTKE